MQLYPFTCNTKKRCVFFKTLRVCIAVFLFSGFHAFSAAAQVTPSIIIDSVSVIDDNSIIIGWSLETDHEEGYIEIHGRTSGAHNVIATVPLHQSYYIDSGINTNLRAYSYYVVAWQTNGDIIVAGEEAHLNVFLENVIPDICGKLVFLQWEQYQVETSFGQPQPLPSPFDSYRVSLSFNESEFVTVYETGQQNLAAIPAEEPGAYCFRIQAFIQGTEITASSNVICTSISFLPQPQYFVIRKVSVAENSDHVELVFHADNSVPNPAYVIKRFDAATELFSPLDTLETSQQTITYTDFSAMPSEQEELYTVEVLDSCRVVVWQSDEVATVYLTAESVSPVLIELQWNEYSGWDHEVGEYILQRRTGEFAFFEDLVVLPPGTSSFSDDISFFEQDVFTEEISYRILALEAMGNPFGFMDTVSSNVAVVSREVEVFIPNAFKPSSQIPENRVFKPMFSALSPSEYSLALFNRWGQKVFSTDDFLQPWDGQFNGNEAPAGVYSFVLRFKDRQGNEKEKRGAVLLIR